MKVLLIQKVFFRIVFVLGLLILILFAVSGNAAEDEDITISANTSWSAGSYTYRDITITNNATLTLQGNTGDGSGVTINARNITIDSGSSISANAQGYPSDGGPGAGTTYSTYGGGGGHGGKGGNARYTSGSQGLGGTYYGDNFKPEILGSGGGGGGTSQGGAGGGAIILNLSGNLVANGNITANGGNAAHSRRGGGAGGTIRIIANSVGGSASITANGGASGGEGGGGGGGRISIYYQNEMTVNAANITANGGDGYLTNDGAEGTVFLYDSDDHNGIIRSNMRLETTAGLAEDGSSTDDGQYYFNNLLITNTSTVVFDGNYSNDEDGSGILLLLSGSLDLDSGSTIDAAGEGYGPLSGPGKGASSNSVGSGGGYGGNALDIGAALGGKKYGSAINPDDLGSGGGGPSSVGGAGGGLVKIICDGDANISGTIDASGDQGRYFWGDRGGGGSGGTVFIKADNITDDEETGVIDASGGDGESGGYGGGGGGGRVALFYSAMTFNTNNISVAGGRKIGGDFSESGTVFLYNTTTGDVTVSRDMTFYATEGIGRDGTIRSDGVYYFNNLTINNNATLTLGGTYSNDSDGHGVYLLLDGDMTIESGSTLSADGQGYASEEGEGPGQGSGGLRSGSGGSYGGLGGEGYSLVGGSDPTQTYGSDYLKAPYKLGSGGGGCWINQSGGSGGGAITIRVLGDLEINGVISANGEDGEADNSDYGSGGGSGGSIYITADNISGSGEISAGGGAGGANWAGGGGGGGGRISIIYYTSMTLSAENITASGGTGSVSPDRDGADGSVNIEQKTLPEADFNLVNPNNGSTEYTNTTNVEIDPDDDDVSQYYEIGESTLVPLFNDSNWKDVSDGKTLSDGEGEKTLSAWLKDEDQLISPTYGQATIILDQTSPGLIINQTDETVNSSTYEISGEVSDALSGVDTLIISGVEVNSAEYQSLDSGTPIMVNPDGTFEVEVVLQPGENNITFVVTDNAGNDQTDLLTVIYQKESPTATPSVTSATTTTASPIPTAIAASTTSTLTDESARGANISSGESTSTGGSNSSESPVDIEKTRQQVGDDFAQDGQELVFYTSDPIIYGRSQPEAVIKLRLNSQEFQTIADKFGNWHYQFKGLAKGTYDLFVYEYTKNGDLIRSTTYTLKIADKPADEAASVKPSFSFWWLLIIPVAALIYLYLKSKNK